MEPATIAAIASVAGAGLSALSGSGNTKRQIAAQKEFAQHGIQWKVEDAQRAGIHPLYALGAQTHSFSPIAVNDPFAGMGQDISRAVLASADAKERKDAEATMFMLEAERRSDERIYRAAQERRAEEAHNLALQQGIHDVRRMELAESEQTLRNMVFLDQLNRSRGNSGGRGGVSKSIPAPVSPLMSGNLSSDSLRERFMPGQADKPETNIGLKRAWETVQTSPIHQRDFMTNDFLSDSELYQAYKMLQGMKDMYDYKQQSGKSEPWIRFSWNKDFGYPHRTRGDRRRGAVGH